FKKLTDKEREQLRKENKCYYCKKPGHRLNECRSRQYQQSKQRSSPQPYKPKPFSAALTYDQGQRPITWAEWNAAGRPTRPLESMRTEGLQCLGTNGYNSTMTAVIKINGKEARTLCDTGTTGINLISSNFAAT